MSQLTSTPVRSRTLTWEDPLPGAALARTIPGIDFLQALAEGSTPPPPLVALLGIEIEAVAKGHVVFALEPAECHYNPMATVHGGVSATLCDSAMGCAIHSLLPAGVGYTTLELNVQYVRAITSASGRLYCSGDVIHLGGRTATAEARVTDEAGTLYAHASTTCLILRP